MQDDLAELGLPFDSPDWRLGDLLRDIGKGRCSCPTSQREWEWDDRRIVRALHDRSPRQHHVVPSRSVKLTKTTPKEAVCTVFEEVNTGGVPLNVFELLTATFAGDVDYHTKHDSDSRLNRKRPQPSSGWAFLAQEHILNARDVP